MNYGAILMTKSNLAIVIQKLESPRFFLICMMDRGAQNTPS